MADENTIDDWVNKLLFALEDKSPIRLKNGEVPEDIVDKVMDTISCYHYVYKTKRGYTLSLKPLNLKNAIEPITD